MATRLKNVDEIVSANNTKTTVLDYTPVTVTPDGSQKATVDLSAGNNFSVSATGGITLEFSSMTGREGQSGNIWITNGADGVSLASGIKKSGEITADHWVSYYVINSSEVVISVSGAVA